jgi:hypothetical protein
VVEGLFDVGWGLEDGCEVDWEGRWILGRLVSGWYTLELLALDQE